ncbi:dynamin-1-like protein [Chironomus tepperi]|uniref:dynamin-1-like protein n=1 Tax=Chironomus tepperi TaxID=113505 RepID=UPI00391F0A9F
MMTNLIVAINKIQDIFNTLKIQNSIKLPQIVMLGAQSSGKSSVLESIVHRPFLPRGSGIVTRCPLVLQLIDYKVNGMKYRDDENDSTKFQEWGEFLHMPDNKFTDFEEIRKEIERRTDELAGSNKGICHEPINLKIYSPNVVTLTLVDLPGITKIPVGDQPADIEAQIKKLIMQYIKNPNSIILSVSAANADLATSESIKYAKLVDPQGIRTLSVLTKLDLMDKGTNAYDMLAGKVIPVKLGTIGTINRSQQDINDLKSIDQQVVDEREFFDTYYKDIAHQNGVAYLSKLGVSIIWVFRICTNPKYPNPRTPSTCTNPKSPIRTKYHYE